MNDFRSRRLPLFPLITAALIMLLVGWMNATAHVARSTGTAVLPLLWLLLTGIWWALRVKGRKLVRLAALLGVIAVLAVACRVLLRYDGSADGSGMPNFTWRWSTTPELAALTPPPASTTDLSSLPAGLADSLRFMGPNGDGGVAAIEFDPDWQTHPPREVWRKPVGVGWSGFAVAGRRAITQEQRRQTECVTCYDIATGELLWAHEDEARFVEAMGGDGPRATPTIDLENHQLFTLGATGILNCLDLETGATKWSHHILTELGAANPTWGKSSSPLIHGDKVIVSGGTTQPTLVALRRDTGTTVWQAGKDGASYSSPVIRTLAGKAQLVSVNQHSVTGHDPATGAELWSFPWPGDYPKVSQPIAAGPDRILITAGYGVKSHLLEVKPTGEGRFTCTAVWTGKSPRTKFSSASVIGGFAYGLDEGTLACVDLTTGERRWREGRYGFGQHVLTGGLLLIQSEPGFIALVRPNPDRLEELARCPALNSKTWNPPTLAGRWLLVRNDREVVCFELPATRHPAPP